MLERAQRRRLISIIQEKKDLWVPHLGPVDPLKESAPILFMHEKKLVSVKLKKIHRYEILLTLL
jgi:hypothetical protein